MLSGLLFLSKRCQQRKKTLKQKDTFYLHLALTLIHNHIYPLQFSCSDDDTPAASFAR
jgi:hypothetical protein